MHGDDASRADQALVNHLAFWAGPDPARVDALFRRSGRYRDKWDERHYGDRRTYGAGTIDKALKGRTDFYDWSPPNGRIEFLGAALQRQSPGRRHTRPTLTIAPLRCGGHA